MEQNGSGRFGGLCKTRSEGSNLGGLMDLLSQIERNGADWGRFGGIDYSLRVLDSCDRKAEAGQTLSLIHISEPTRPY